MLIIGVLIGIALLVLLVRSRVAPQRTVTVSQIPQSSPDSYRTVRTRHGQSSCSRDLGA